MCNKCGFKYTNYYFDNIYNFNNKCINSSKMCSNNNVNNFEISNKMLICQRIEIDQSNNSMNSKM